MKTFYLLSTAAVALFLSSCASPHYGYGPQRGFATSTVAIQANNGFGLRPVGYGGLGYGGFGLVNQARPFLPVRNVIGTRNFVQPRVGYSQRGVTSNRQGVHQVRNQNGYRNSNQRPQSRPSYSGQRPSYSGQRSSYSGQRSSSSNRGTSRGAGNGGSSSRMTMASSRGGSSQRRGR